MNVLKGMRINNNEVNNSSSGSLPCDRAWTENQQERHPGDSHKPLSDHDARSKFIRSSAVQR